MQAFAQWHGKPLASAIHFAHDDVDRAEDDHNVGNGVAETNVFEDGQVDEARRANPVAIRTRAALSKSRVRLSALRASLCLA